MNTTHKAIVNDDSDGFAPATLTTTVNGLELILQALRIVEPEAPEVGLHRKLIIALEQAMPLCPKHIPLTPKTEAEIYDFNEEVFKRQAKFQDECDSSLRVLGLLV